MYEKEEWYLFNLLPSNAKQKPLRKSAEHPGLETAVLLCHISEMEPHSSANGHPILLLSNIKNTKAGEDLLMFVTLSHKKRLNGNIT